MTEWRADPDDLLEQWAEAAEENAEEWGQQSVETLLLAAQEELGELTQALLEYQSGADHYARLYEEINDLGPVLIQLWWATNAHRLDTDREGSRA